MRKKLTDSQREEKRLIRNEQRRLARKEAKTAGLTPIRKEIAVFNEETLVKSVDKLKNIRAEIISEVVNAVGMDAAKTMFKLGMIPNNVKQCVVAYDKTIDSLEKQSIKNGISFDRKPLLLSM